MPGNTYKAAWQSTKQTESRSVDAVLLRLSYSVHQRQIKETSTVAKKKERDSHTVQYKTWQDHNHDHDH